MKFVTWENVGIDRIGCAWLIRRFVDRDADFFFISEGSKVLPASTEPFDIPGVRLSHHEGHCSFFAMLRHFNLYDPVLRRIARIIDEADTVQDEPLEAAAAGLDLICRGIRRICSDDQTALQRGAMVFDALYAELSETMPGGKKQ